MQGSNTDLHSVAHPADLWTGGCTWTCVRNVDRRGEVEEEFTENMTVGVRKHFYPRDLTRLFVQSVKEETGSGATGPETNLSIPSICYLLPHPAQRASPWPSSLLPLCRVPSPRAVIKTTGGSRNAAWLLPACNRHHLDHKRGGGVLPLPSLPHP